MGLFKKRSGMIDVVDMQRRGLVKLPARKPSSIKAGKDGFVELKASPSSEQTLQTQSATKEEKSGGGWFGNFFGGDQSSAPQSAASSFSTESDGYNKREVDAKMEEMDNKIYKMEQRLEVLERKNGVGTW